MSRFEEPRPRVPPLPWSPYALRERSRRTLPMSADPPPRDFLDVLRARRSSVGVRVSENEVAALLWHSVGVRTLAGLGRAGIETERRAIPSPGGLQPITYVCVSNEPSCVSVYDAVGHAFVELEVDTSAVVAASFDDVLSTVGADFGWTIRMIGDVSKLDAAYTNAASLMWRAAGCSVATIGLCAEWLGLRSCAVGTIGADITPMLGFPDDRFIGLGAVHVTRRPDV